MHDDFSKNEVQLKKERERERELRLVEGNYLDPEEESVLRILGPTESESFFSLLVFRQQFVGTEAREKHKLFS